MLLSPICAFHIYALDGFFNLDSSTKRKDWIKAMDGHALQYGATAGTYRR